MMFVSALMLLIPPALPPVPWRPEAFPVYEATCHAIDGNGVAGTGRLVVTGQDTERRLSLRFRDGGVQPSEYEGASQAMVLNPVTDGTYSYTEFLPIDANPARLAVVLQALGPNPDTIFLKISAPPKSPVFEEPALVGLCRVDRTSEGNPQ